MARTRRTPLPPSPPLPETRGVELDHRGRLERLRDQLATAIEAAEPNMLPQLAGQYRATLDDLAKLDAAQPKASIQDDLKRRREERRRSQRAV